MGIARQFCRSASIDLDAKPGKNGITVTAEFKNGIKKSYLMKRGADGSTIEMTAQNSK